MPILNNSHGAKTPYAPADRYLNNPNLPNSQYVHAYTAWELDELKKCKADPVYFTKNYIKIIVLGKGIVLFPLWDWQADYIRCLHENRFTISKIGRQSGKTTTTIAYLLHQLLFNPTSINIALLAHKETQAQEILKRLKLAFEYLPNFLQQGVLEWNKRSIEFANRAIAVSGATSNSSIRGSSRDIVYLDEFAHVPNNQAEDFFDSTYPVITSGKDTKMIVTSTPKGLNHFYNLWKKAEKKQNSYVTFKIDWWQIPGRDEAWKKETIANTSERQFAQEYECDFLGSSNTLISAKKLGELIECEKINEINDIYLDIFEEPETDHGYVATIDTSEGLGADYSAISIFDVTEYPYKQVAKYRNNEIDVMILPTIIYSLAKRYNDAFCLIEIKSTGLQVASILWDDLGYENLIRVNTDKKLGQVFDLTGQNAQLGLKTSVQTKRIGCTNLKTLIESDKLIVQDETTILELRTFISNGKSWEADEGNNDDLVTTLVLFAWLITQKSFINLIDQDIRKNLNENKYHLPDDTASLPILIESFEENIVPGWIIDSDNYHDKPKENRSPNLMGEDAYWDGKFIEDNPFNRAREPEAWDLWNKGWIKSSNIF